jgi:hypothetical protein
MIVRGIGVHLQLTQPGTVCDTNRVAGRSDRMHNKRVQRTPAAPLTRNVRLLKKGYLFNYLSITYTRFKAPNKLISGTSFSLVYTANEGVKVLI